MISPQARGGAVRPLRRRRSLPSGSPSQVEMHELRARAMALMARVLDADPRSVHPDAFLVDDLGADSLQIVEVALAFEDMFGVDFRDEQIERVRTVGGALACLEAALRRRDAEGAE